MLQSIVPYHRYFCLLRCSHPSSNPVLGLFEWIKLKLVVLVPIILKNISLMIPRGKLIVITGLSGSGKSSLAFDTLYGAEGKLRYVESLSTYARQFLSLMEKPDVDHIEGLPPAISVEQKSISHSRNDYGNPRLSIYAIRSTMYCWQRRPSVRW